MLMEDVAEEKKWRESMGRRAERYMRGFGIEDEINNENENENGGMDMDMGRSFFSVGSVLWTARLTGRVTRFNCSIG